MAMKLYVGGLAYSVSESELETVFSEFGKINSVNIIKDRETGQSKGFGFVEMENDSDAKKAISSLNRKEISGRTIMVNEARPQENRR